MLADGGTNPANGRGAIYLARTPMVEGMKSGGGEKADRRVDGSATAPGTRYSPMRGGDVVMWITAPPCIADGHGRRTNRA